MNTKRNVRATRRANRVPNRHGARPGLRRMGIAAVLIASVCGCGTVERTDDSGSAGETEAPEATTCPEWLEGCLPQNQCTACDPSCGDYCQNLNGSVCGPEDCMTCPEGSSLEVIWSDGTGRCVVAGSEQECACDGGDYECRGDDTLVECADGCNWNELDCHDLCRDAGYDYAVECGYDAESAHDLCYCDYFAESGRGIGDACEQNTECSSEKCVSWCSVQCESSLDCNGAGEGGQNLSSGSYNYCVKASSGEAWCFPWCASDDDCRAYAGTHCVLSVQTVSGTRLAGVCGH